MSVFGSGAQEGQGSEPVPAAVSVEADDGAASGALSTANRLPVIVLGKTLTFKGELSADEDMILFGRVEGSVRHTSVLTVGAGGVVIGNLRAKVLNIKGTVEGDLEATESVTISPTAIVIGDVVAPRVCIVEGAQFNGAVEMPEVSAAQLAAARAASAPAAAAESLAEKDVERLLDER